MKYKLKLAGSIRLIFSEKTTNVFAFLIFFSSNMKVNDNKKIKLIACLQF